jgi:hypothetical protein
MMVKCYLWDVITLSPHQLYSLIALRVLKSFHSNSCVKISRGIRAISPAER